MLSVKTLFAICLVLSCSFNNVFGQHAHVHDDHYHEHHDHDHEHDHNPSFKYSREANEAIKQASHDHTAKPKPPTWDSQQELWLYAMGSTLIISAAPFFILFLGRFVSYF